MYKNGSGDVVPVGFLDPDNSQVLAGGGTSTAFTADTVVLITPTASGCWIAINATPTAAANTSGSHYVDSAQDLAVKSGDKINSTGALCITPYK
jgi:hypothetical protein